MLPDLAVDVPALRRAAAAINETAGRVTEAGRTPPSPDTTPRWATTDAARGAAEAAGLQLSRIGADIADAARRIKACADEYEAADTRADRRLRAVR